MFNTARLLIDVQQSGEISAQKRYMPQNSDVEKRQIPSLNNNNYPPILQVTGLQGFVDINAKMGTLVRTTPHPTSRPLQILVTDQDLVSLIVTICQ